MKILFLSDNFPPETNAPAARIHDHAREWVRAGHHVTVVTCAPNFPTGRVYQGYRNRLLQREMVDGIEVVRVWTYITANEGFFKRTLDYVSFMTSAFVASFLLPRPDVVVATSPQFFAALGGWLVSCVKRRPFVIELRDLWPETILAVGAMRRGRAVAALEWLARFLYHRADLMVPVTQAFARHLEDAGVDPARIKIVTNGIEPDEFQAQRTPAETRARLGIPADAFVAGYIGTLGLCHGLGALLEAAEGTRDDPGLRYLLVGEGADRAQLEERVRERGLENVTILGGQPRAEALELLNAVDVSLVMLRDSPLFRTVIPSKIFEAMELGKPIALGVRGEARQIVVEEVGCGLDFPPEDSEALVELLQRLRSDAELRTTLARHGGTAVRTRFRRSTLAAEMLGAIERCVRPTADAARRRLDAHG